MKIIALNPALQNNNSHSASNKKIFQAKLNAGEHSIYCLGLYSKCTSEQIERLVAEKGPVGPNYEGQSNFEKMFEGFKKTFESVTKGIVGEVMLVMSEFPCKVPEILYRMPGRPDLLSCKPPLHLELEDVSIFMKNNAAPFDDAVRTLVSKVSDIMIANGYGKNNPFYNLYQTLVRPLS